MGRIEVTVRCHPWQAAWVAILGQLIAESDPDWSGDFSDDVYTALEVVLDAWFRVVGPDAAELNGIARERYKQLWSIWRNGHEKG